MACKQGIYFDLIPSQLPQEQQQQEVEPPPDNDLQPMQQEEVCGFQNENDEDGCLGGVL